MSLLEVSGVYKKQGTGFELRDIRFTQQRYQKIAVAGETGSGKSTLLRIVSGLINPDAGEVLFENERVKKVPEEKLIPGHKGISYLSQHFELPNYLTVAQVLSYSSHFEERDAADLYDILRIDHLLGRRTDRLSGGEKQRIALAKLLVTSPRLLVLDEPFSNLDMIHKTILKSVIRDLGAKLHLTCLLTSHDPLDTLSWADDIIVMKDGQIIQQGSPEQIYRQPVSEYTAGLFGKFNVINIAKNPAFSTLSGIVNNGRDLLVRPEDFRIVPGGPQTIAGKVKEIFYFGAYYEAEIEIEGITVTIRIQEPGIVKGNTVYLALAADKIWYL